MVRQTLTVVAARTIDVDTHKFSALTIVPAMSVRFYEMKSANELTMEGEVSVLLGELVVRVRDGVADPCLIDKVVFIAIRIVEKRMRELVKIILEAQPFLKKS